MNFIGNRWQTLMLIERLAGFTPRCSCQKNIKDVQLGLDYESLIPFGLQDQAVKSRDKKARHSASIDSSCDFSPTLTSREKVPEKLVRLCEGIPCHFLQLHVVLRLRPQLDCHPPAHALPWTV